MATAPNAAHKSDANPANLCKTYMPTEIYGDFEWDSEKRAANIAKHGFDFVDAIVFFTDLAMDKTEERVVSGEKRYLSIGCVGDIVVATIYTYRGKRRRIISMRKAKRYERGHYTEFLTRIKDRLGKN